MSRPVGVVLGLALAGWGCQLLQPYPGGGNPADAIGGGGNGGGGFDQGSEQEPLFDPAIDPSIKVTSNIDDVIAIPGSAFTIDLSYIADNANVVGGGIRFPGSDEIQWTFIEGLEGMGSGDMRFGYVVAKEVCADIPNLCHAIETTQFAVARNTIGDVDGDGNHDGEFVVSPGKKVTVVLQCATCDSKSCQDLLPVGECFFCPQPTVCRDYFERCLAEGQPNFDTSEAELFDALFGAEGILWSTRDGCVLGENACDKAQEAAEMMPDECSL